MKPFDFLDVRSERLGDIDVLFPGWTPGDERICVYSPHDDDAIIGAGYAMRAAMENGGKVYIVIVCSGDCGYSTPEEKETIVARRHSETVNVYRAFGVPEDHILFLNYPDFSALSYVGRNVSPTREGNFRSTLTMLRQQRITRILSPNHYHEHIDHMAASLMASYDAPQAGDVHSVDWAAPYPVRSTAEYAVWAELDPEDALVAGRDVRLRADTVLIASEAVERAVGVGLTQYVSQQQIIADLIHQREARRLPDGRFIEVYRRFDPRPKLDFEPYKALIGKLLK